MPQSTEHVKHGSLWKLASLIKITEHYSCIDSVGAIASMSARKKKSKSRPAQSGNKLKCT